MSELERLTEFVKREEPHVAIHFARGEWAVGLTWGKEAEDSPMAGAAAYGVDPDLGSALAQALDEAKV